MILKPLIAVYIQVCESIIKEEIYLRQVEGKAAILKVPATSYSNLIYEFVKVLYILIVKNAS